MTYLVNHILNLILCNVFFNNFAELSQVDNFNLITTDVLVKNTVETLFAVFKIRDVNHNQKVKQYSTIHNFFVSITLTDCDNLKKIAKLTRVYIDNNTENFITQINELFNEGEATNITANDKYINTYIDTFTQKLKYLNMFDLKDFYLKHLDIAANLLTNVTKEVEKEIHSHDANVKRLIGFWRPSLRRIFHGKSIRIKDYPFMVSIQNFNKFHCSGAIIKSDLVITSSSCLQLAWNNRFYRENPAFLAVRVGSDFPLSGGEIIPVLEINFHPEYDPKTLKNNLAVMRLTRRISFNSSVKVRKIDIDRNPVPLSNVAIPRITVVGWGARDRSNLIHHPRHNRLTFAKLKYYSLKKCQRIYKSNYVTTKNFCAGFKSKGGACNLDAGGPGVVHNTLMGVISFGAVSCGASKSPTVFTKLGFYADWIDKIMKTRIPRIYRLKDTPTDPPIIYSDVTSSNNIQLHPITHKITPKDPCDVDFARLVGDKSYLKDYLKSIFKTDNTPSKESTEEANTKFVNGRKLKARKNKSVPKNKHNTYDIKLESQRKGNNNNIVTKKNIQKRVTSNFIKNAPKHKTLSVISIWQHARDDNDAMRQDMIKSAEGARSTPMHPSEHSTAKDHYIREAKRKRIEQHVSIRKSEDNEVDLKPPETSRIDKSDKNEKKSRELDDYIMVNDAFYRRMLKRFFT